MLIGKQTRLIPGVFTIGKAAFAEQLGWSVAAFDSAWSELATLGMARADWTEQLVWVPKAIQYNPPANPNVILGWANDWDELPECALASDIREAFALYLADRGPTFVAALDKACPPLPGSVPRVRALTHTLPVPDPVPGFGNGLANGLANGLGNRSGNRLGNGYQSSAFADHWGIDATDEEKALNERAKSLFDFTLTKWQNVRLHWSRNAEYFRMAVLFCDDPENGVDMSDMELVVEYIAAKHTDYMSPRPVFGKDDNLESWINAARRWRDNDETESAAGLAAISGVE